MSDSSLFYPSLSLFSLPPGPDLDEAQERRGKNYCGTKVSGSLVFRFLVAFVFRFDVVLDGVVELLWNEQTDRAKWYVLVCS